MFAESQESENENQEGKREDKSQRTASDGNLPTMCHTLLGSMDVKWNEIYVCS